MSVLSPVIDYLDLDTKRIYLLSGVRSYHPVDDIYQEIRNRRRTDESIRTFNPQVTASGHVSKGGGRFTPRLATFNDGWKIVPEDVTHTLEVTGEQITDSGGSGSACIDVTPLSPGVRIVINYAPPDAEVIEVATGGSSGYTPAQIWAYVFGAAGTAKQVLEATAADAKIARQLAANKAYLNPETAVLTVYDDDMVTVLRTFSFADASNNPSVTAPLRRTPL